MLATVSGVDSICPGSLNNERSRFLLRLAVRRLMSETRLHNISLVIRLVGHPGVDNGRLR